MDRLDVYVIGAGGIGRHLLPPLAQELNNVYPGSILTIFDGKRFTERNGPRQGGEVGTYKAQWYENEIIRKDYRDLIAIAENVNIGPDNVDKIPEGSVTFLCVDNPYARNLVANHASCLQDATVISAGNKITSCTIQQHVRKGGVDITIPINTILNPEIREAVMPPPERLGCDEEPPDTQLLAVNMLAAALALNTFRTLPGVEASTWDIMYVETDPFSLRTKSRKGFEGV